MTESRHIDVLGTIWHADHHKRTSLGCLVEAAKDRDDSTARARIVDEVHAWVADGGLEVDSDAIVVGIPSSPDRPNLLVSAVARAVATATGSASVDAVVRHRVTGRLRDLDPTERPAMVLAADYEVVEDVGGRHVVLVDDVVLSGTTLHHVADLLLVAGATSVRPVAIARSRRG
jgi:predicted amidophosphoribosyltransferase